MAIDQFRLTYLQGATEPQAAVRRLASLTGAAQRATARQAEAQYLVTNLVPLITTQIAATTNPVAVTCLQGDIAGINAGLATAQGEVAAANAAVTTEQSNQTALAAQLAALIAAG